MAPFGYRVRADTASNHLRDDDRTLPLEIEVSIGRTVRLKVERGRADDLDQVLLFEDGFASEVEATNAGSETYAALRAAAVEADVPMSFGNHKVTSRIGKAVAADAGDAGIADLRSDVLGVDVFDTGGLEVTWLKARARAITSRPVEQLADKLRARLADAPVDLSNPRLGLACELYLLTTFETSARARFVNLVTVLEALTQRTPREAAAVEFVNSCLARLPDSTLDESTAASLGGNLRDLRKISISEAVRRLGSVTGLEALDLGGKEPREFLGSCYKIRSDLVHGNPISEAIDLHVEGGRLRRIVRTILLSRL